MTRPSFLNHEKPLIVSMLQAREPERIKELMRLSVLAGADAFGMQFCRLKPRYRTKEIYRELFALASPHPVYVTNYGDRWDTENTGKSYDVLASELIELAECGATLCDVMGDFYDTRDDELALEDDAIKKQIKLIDELHARGAEVLMSSHVLKFTPAERVLEIALEHKRRGADISKIVTGANNMEEQIENLRIVNILKEKLGIPFLFLSGGECHISRRISTALGNCMTLCVAEHDELSTKAQPLVSDAVILRDKLGI